MTAEVSVTVDVDGEAGLPDGGRGYEHRLSSRSERVFGLVRGLPRVLDVLEEFGVTATFYVPGVTAERHPDEIGALAGTRHEIGHHGHTHRRPDTLDAEAQRADVLDGAAALASLTGLRPSGYRAPGWELTTTTLDLLVECGFAFDSSLMGDDRPYEQEAGGGRLLELPVHWSLDDAPHFAAGGTPDALLAVLLAELDAAIADDRLLTITFHPEILGRPSRVPVLRSLLDAAGARGCPVTALRRCAGV